MARSLNTALQAIVRNPYWRESDAATVLAAWQDSGLTLSTFARQCGLSAKRLSRWRKKLSSGPPVRFHPVEVIVDAAPRASVLEPIDGSSVELVLHSGRRIAVRRGFDPVLLAEVVQAVESWSC